MSYLEFPLRKFLKMYPGCRSIILSSFPGIDLNDKKYVVRVDFESGLLEIGYPSDGWTIGGNV